MNIAFQAFVLLLLYFPGALALSGYLGKISQKEEMPQLTSSFSNRTGIALVLALLLHATWLGAGEFFSHVYSTAWKPDPQLILDLLISGGKEPVDQRGDTGKIAATSVDSNKKPVDKTAIAKLSNNLWPMFWYFITIYIGAWISGILLRVAVRKTHLDHRYEFFRFSNHWHYALKGEKINFGTWNGIKPAVTIQALVEIEGTPYLYNGIVVGWHHSPASGDLEWICLRNTARGIIKDGVQSENLEQLPKGEFFLRFSEVKNFVLRYYDVKGQTEGG